MAARAATRRCGGDEVAEVCSGDVDGRGDGVDALRGRGGGIRC